MSVKRFNPDINVGLNVEEVTKRYESNLVNFDPSSKTKSFKQIILENVFTLFNIINIILSIAIILVGSYKNLAFMIIIILLYEVFCETLVYLSLCCCRRYGADRGRG